MKLPRKLLAISAFLIMFIFIPTDVYAAEDWTVAGEAYVDEDDYVLTNGSTYAEVGGFLKTVPINTQKGFTLTFQLLEQPIYRSGDGVQLVMASKPIELGDYGTTGYEDYYYDKEIRYYGVKFLPYRVDTVTYTDGYYPTSLSSYSISVNDDVWHNVKIVYKNYKLSVYMDDILLHQTLDVKLKYNTYIGFTASTDYDGRTKQAVRNIQFEGEDLSTVIFDSNGGICGTENKYIRNGSKVSLPKAYRINYKFVGWFTEPEGGEQVNTDTYVFDKNQTVYAHWEEDIIVGHELISNSDWKVSDNAKKSGKQYVLTSGESYDDLGAVLKQVPIDVRDGFRISFDIYEGDYYKSKSDGIKFVMINEEIVTSYYNLGYSKFTSSYAENLRYHAVLFTPYGLSIETKGNNGYSDTLKETEIDVCDSKWHDVTIEYKNKTLTVYYDGLPVVKSAKVKLTNKTYIGFTSTTAWNCRQKNAIRNIELYAKNLSTVTFDANGGACKLKNKLIVNGSKVSLPQAYRVDYEFLGWYTKKTGGVQVNTDTYTFAEKQTVYAHWKKNVTISQKEIENTDWKVANSAKKSSKQYILTSGSSYSDMGRITKKIPIDTRNGFRVSFEIFEGNEYNGKKDKGINFVMANQEIDTSRSTVLDLGYYEYIYSSNTNLRYYGVNFRASTVSIETKEGTDAKILKVSDVEVCDSKWHKVVIEYKGNKLTVYFDGIPVVKASNVKLKYRTYLGFTATTGSSSRQKNAIRNLTVNAKNTNEVTFNANGGTCSIAERYMLNKYDGQLPTPKRTSYIFQGWYTKKSGGVKVDDATYTFKDGQTLYARWKDNRKKVTFNANGGTVKTQSIMVNHATEIGTMPTPTRKGYVFDGWYTKKTGGLKVESTKVIKKHMTLYAHWISNSKKVTISFDANGGKCTKSSITVTYGGKLGTLPTPTRSNYIFLGWYTKASGGLEVTKDTKTIEILPDKTLYAHWKKESSSNNNSSSSSSDWESSSSSSNTNRLRCVSCGGDGEKTCSNCSGAGGKYEYGGSTPNYSGSLGGSSSYRTWKTCYRCHGSGEQTCTSCGGDGYR